MVLSTPSRELTYDLPDLFVASVSLIGVWPTQHSQAAAGGLDCFGHAVEIKWPALHSRT